MDNKQEKKKISSYIGDSLTESCSLNWFKYNLPSQLVEFLKCQDNASSHLTSLGFSNGVINQCPNATKKWLILSRLKLNFIPEEALICPKHRFKFGVGWQPASSCQYPGHKATTKKLVNPRKILIQATLECNALFNSAISKVIVQVGSEWCNNCCLYIHSALLKQSIVDISNKCCLCTDNHIEYEQIIDNMSR